VKLKTGDKDHIPPLLKKEALEYCLNKLRRAETFKDEIDWGTEIVTGLTVEEIIGGLLLGEHFKRKLITEMKQKLDKKSRLNFQCPHCGGKYNLNDILGGHSNRRCPVCFHRLGESK